jgi:hypothetical protein
MGCVTVYEHNRRHNTYEMYIWSIFVPPCYYISKHVFQQHSSIITIFVSVFYGLAYVRPPHEAQTNGFLAIQGNCQRHMEPYSRECATVSYHVPD